VLVVVVMVGMLVMVVKFASMSMRIKSTSYSLRAGKYEVEREVLLESMGRLVLEVKVD